MPTLLQSSLLLQLVTTYIHNAAVFGVYKLVETVKHVGRDSYRAKFLYTMVTVQYTLHVQGIDQMNWSCNVKRKGNTPDEATFSF